jgi:DNA invertase Pin-like site-specific DNA recombinase
MSSEKITATHLQRTAFIYVRQSSPTQLRHHHESRRRQYDLAAEARRCGWTDVVVIDEDLGKSGASATKRRGFQRLVADVSLGKAGAVFGLEVSRLARNNRDWYQLMDLCALTHTLIVDAEGVYDPRQLNDRLLLGLKGTMSEAELGWIRQRAHEGLLAKARRGELILGLPVGYVRTRDGRIEKHPDRRVQAAVTLVFDKFTELMSVRQTLLWFRGEQIPLPSVRTDSLWDPQLEWRLPVYNTLLHFLQNPTYGGAYAFGKTESRTRVIDGAAHISRGHRRTREQWTVLLRDRHEGYIAWETYERNQQLIAENAHMRGVAVKGAVRRGRSLLAGLLRCGHCGRRLHVTYSGTGGFVPRYGCRGAMINHGTGWCISFGGLRIDGAIEREVLRVLERGAIEAALDAALHDRSEHQERIRAVELELREARYQAERAQRQYDAVEPENRLVAETLEQRWNAALERVHELERRLDALQGAIAHHAMPSRAELVSLAQDFPAVWGSSTTEHVTKKRLVRLLIDEIVARVPNDTHIELVIRWKGGLHTQLAIPKNRTGQHRYRTSHDLIEAIRGLAQCLPDGQIARVLNRLGYRTGHGNTWTQSRVTSLRSAHQIPVFTRSSGDGAALTMAQAAAELGVSPTTVRHLIMRGALPATQVLPHAPWVIRRSDLQLKPVQQLVSAIKRGAPLPRTASAQQLSFANPTT